MKPTPGYQTTEFWLACGVQITSLITALSTSDTAAKISAGVVAAIAVGGYLLTRWRLKSQAAENTLTVRLDEQSVRESIVRETPRTTGG